jgi:hypothetical protein
MLEGIFQQAPLARLMLVEANDPTSPAAQIMDRAFEQAAAMLVKDLQGLGAQVPSRTYLKSIMTAVQWIAFDAIRKGLSRRDTDEEKQAACELIVRALG